VIQYTLLEIEYQQENWVLPNTVYNEE
jgi:hypothetical protein